MPYAIPSPTPSSHSPISPTAFCIPAPHSNAPVSGSISTTASASQSPAIPTSEPALEKLASQIQTPRALQQPQEASHQQPQHLVLPFPRRNPSSNTSSRTQSRTSSRATSPSATPTSTTQYLGISPSQTQYALPRRPKAQSTLSGSSSSSTSTWMAAGPQAVNRGGLELTGMHESSMQHSPDLLSPPLIIHSDPLTPGASRQLRDSASNVVNSSQLPLTPSGRYMQPIVDEVSRSLERYAREQAETAERKRVGRPPGISQRHSDGARSKGAATPPNESQRARPSGGARSRSLSYTSDAGEATIEGLPPSSTNRKDLDDRLPLPSPGNEPVPIAAKPLTASPKAPVINPLHGSRQTTSLGLRRQPSSSLQLNIPSSPSDPSSHTWSVSTPYSYDQERPTSSMIRKKSGQILKPSLKSRSLSTPHLPIRTFNTTKSEPATPSIDDDDYGDRHKNVRFAGSSGQADDKLENVVLFSREQKVTAVSKAADGGDDYWPVTETETEGDTDGEFVSFRTKRNLAAQLADEAERLQITEISSIVPRRSTDFSPYNREKLNKEEFVILEKVDLPCVGNEPLMLRGSVLVRNVAFQKWVGVRFTLDRWQTVSEVSGLHVNHISSSTTGGTGWDRFSFVIKLEDFKRKLEERELLLCIRFSIEGREWWDSNNGNNYRFGFKKVKKTKSRSFESDAANRRQQASFTSQLHHGIRASGFGRISSWNNPEVGTSTADASNIPPIRTSPLPVILPKVSDTVFSAPSPPDVHEHLQLKTYCAPALPLSPPKEKHSLDSLTTRPLRSESAIVGGQYATLASPETGQSRRRSWNGEGIIEKAADEAIQTGVETETKAIQVDLFTPPLSALSSPPTSTTTSPTSSCSSKHEADLPDVVIDPLEQDNIAEQNNGANPIHDNSYKEFIAKYCFFQSTEAATNAVSPAHSRSATPTGHSTTSSPAFGISSPAYRTLGGATPTGSNQGVIPSETNYFDFNPSSVYWGHYNNAHRSAPSAGNGSVSVSSSSSGSATASSGCGTPLASF